MHFRQQLKWINNVKSTALGANRVQCYGFLLKLCLNKNNRILTCKWLIVIDLNKEIWTYNFKTFWSMWSIFKGIYIARKVPFFFSNIMKILSKYSLIYALTGRKPCWFLYLYFQEIFVLLLFHVNTFQAMKSPAFVYSFVCSLIFIQSPI